MTKNELLKLLEENKKEVEKTMREFRVHSENFDRKIQKILDIL